MESSVFYSSHAEERMKPPSKLMQSLFELCVIVGMDEDTRLIPMSRSRKGSAVSIASSDHSDEDTVFNKEYEPSILAVLSGQIVAFPETKEPINGDPYYTEDHIAYNSQGTLSPAKKSGKLRFATPVEVPLGTDLIFGLPQFCLADGACVYESKPDENMHTLVLTDIDGRRSYCTCLTFYKPYYVTEDVEIPGQFLLSVEETEETNGQSQICYVPTCCCLISKFPYFQIAKDCLSSFLPVLNKNGKKMRQSLMQLISHLCQVPIPPPGPINIEFELCNMKHLVRSAREPKKRIIDMEYHLPFLCFSVENILLLLSCVLTQQRIIFLASNYSLLTPITEALLSYIQPLMWGLTYVPVLPSYLIDLLEAPGSFIMGCDSKHYFQVKSLMAAQDEDSSIVCANIDTGEVEIGNNSIPLIPEPYREIFLENVSIFDAAELRKRRRVFNQECANSILEVCFELMLNLFREFTHFIKGGSDKGQQVLFDRVGFVECKPEKDREFFRQLCKSHAFSTYLCERYEKDEVDFFSSAISENAASVGRRKRSASTIELKQSRSSSNLSNGKLSLYEDEVFKLTPFVDEGLHTGRFYQNCIKDLNLLVQSSDLKNSSIKACYLYLRGMIYVANGQIYEGLDDFFALPAKSVQIFPTNSIVEILSQFDVGAMQKLKHKSYFRRMDLLLRKHKKVSGSVRVRKQLIFDGVPRYPVGRDEFIERVMLCQITESNKTAERLFKVLLAGTGEKSAIDPGTFSDLYETLNQADVAAQSVDIQGVIVEDQEFVIKVSSLCTTNSGVGRLLLTNFRLLFMADGGSSCKNLTRLLDIARIEKYQHYFVLPRGVPALKITKKEKSEKPLFACLKGERDTWCSYLKEMAVCHERAETFKDPQFVSLGSQNVMLADALVKSGLSQNTALAMCYFTKTNEPVKDISGDTEKFLLQRLNPSEKETITTTVEALVYVPRLEQDENVYPEQIWCGMGSGSIVIFKRTMRNERWSFETQISCANDRVSCLLAVGSSHVWAGSFDATIYVFDRCSYKANQHLEEHSDIISAIFLQQRDEQASIVWSASLNGQIIGWDAETLTPKKKIKLNHPARTFVSFMLIGKYFWCGIRSAIVIADSEGEGDIKNKLEVKDGNNVLSVDCMISLSPKQVWCACGRQGKIAIFNTETLTYTLLPINMKENNIALTKMALMGNEVWLGNRNGHIYAVRVIKEKSIKKIKELKVKKTLKIHDDSVRSMCVINGGYVATGPGSRDGKIAIWRYEEETDQDLGFEMFSSEEVHCAAEQHKKSEHVEHLKFLGMLK
ncbi:DENN domain-containing 3-like [Paramuricea clavata]|uniref:DENN domain-containing 3-like n=1 Tax=Paramuricea clavata TaxID=317549 RepID=A0A6S7H0I9_PARCT|nr:DENN domain-containing 3-like [Paramuricea clavata]